MQIGLGLFAFALFALAAAPAAGQSGEDSSRPRVALETSKGKIVLELYPDRAPKTVENFLAYVEGGFYDGTVFHRVIEGFMVQGGGFTADMERKPTRDPIANESGSALSNERGTIAMARTSDPDSATAQFFINTAANERLDARGGGNSGYTAFGRVVEGMDVVDAIASVPTTRQGMFDDVPVEPVTIEGATVVDGG